jgi:hypothetical protein
MKEAAIEAASPIQLRIAEPYLSCVETLVNVLLSWVPRPLTTAMIAIEIPAAIRRYSMAVAPELSFKKCRTSLAIGLYPVLLAPTLREIYTRQIFHAA